jgi:hypothetical protein
MGNSNKYAEGFRQIFYPFNIGFTYCGYNFPESTAQDSPGCLNISFSGGHISDDLGVSRTGGVGENKLSYQSNTATRKYGWGPSGYYHFDNAVRGINRTTLITDAFLSDTNLHRRNSSRPHPFGALGGFNATSNVGPLAGVNAATITPIPPMLNTIYLGTSKVNNISTRVVDQRGVNAVASINILDLISEGPVEGLVTGKYIYNTSGKKQGDIGYSSAQFQPFISTVNPTTKKESRSIFWNDTPVADNQGFYNFQQIDFKYSYGEKDNAHTIYNPYINLYEDRTDYYGRKVDVNKIPFPTSVTKSISEKAYGGYLKDGPENSNAQYTKVLYPRTYYIYNKEVSSIDINIEVQGLNEQILSGSNAGDIEWKDMDMTFSVSRLMNNMDVIKLDTSKYYPYKTDTYSVDTVTLHGRITSPIIFAYHINLRPYAENYPRFEMFDNQIGWVVDVVQNTIEGIGSSLNSSANVHSITEFYSDRFSYPETAMVLSKFDGRYFDSIPNRSYKLRLLKVKVPINYDPITKNYSGPWNGKFKVAWTDNPAWCFYDLVSNKKYGLGKYINVDLIDKWGLYEIAQYCDELVDDGSNGLEPRFKCNLYITNKEEAYKVLNDMASIFRGILYYSAGQIIVSQDSPKDPIYIFNNSNVIGGNFIYSDASKKSRKTVAFVRFNDELDNYKPAIEYVEDQNSIMKYGIRETEISAFGCTTRNQARRLGKWLLVTENQETELIDFEIGLEGNFVKPGDIIQVYDQNRKNQIYGGRTLELTTGYAILDIPYNNTNLYGLTGVNRNFDFDVLTPSYDLKLGTDLANMYMTGFSDITSSGSTGINESFLRKSQLQRVSYINYNQSLFTSGSGIYSNYIKINFPIAISNSGYNLSQNTVWTIDISNSGYGGVDGIGLNTQPLIDNDSFKKYPGYYLESYLNKIKKYRVLNVVEKDQNSFSINALEYNSEKYDNIDNAGAFTTQSTINRQIPSQPFLTLSGIFRSPSSKSNCVSDPCDGRIYTTNQGGINSIMYDISPPTNSNGLSFYRVYFKSGAFSSSTQSEEEYLVNLITPTDLSQRGTTPQNWIDGNTPYFSTPLYTGSYYVRVYAENKLKERSDYIEKIYNLTNQASSFSVIASGFNIV